MYGLFSVKKTFEWSASWRYSPGSQRCWSLREARKGIVESEMSWKAGSYLKNEAKHLVLEFDCICELKGKSTTEIF